MAPGEAGEASESTAPAATASPSPSTTLAPPTQAVVGEHLVIRWEPLDELMELEAWGEGGSVFHDGQRWVAFMCADVDDGCLTTSVSEDALTWTEPMHPDVTSSSRDVVAGPDGWVLSGKDPDSHNRLEIWRSADGSAWARAGAFQPDDCTRLGCFHEDSLAVAPSGSIVIGSMRDGSIPPSSTGPYASTDGAEWTFVGLEGLGVEAFAFSSIQSTPGGVVLAGTECEGCDLRVWRSSDGLAWEDFGRFPSGPTSQRVGVGRIAAIGELLLAPVTFCDGARCTVEVWGRNEEGPWTRRGSLPGIGFDLAVIDAGPAGPAFLAVGETPSSELVSVVSVDGTRWTELQNIGGPSMAVIEECEYPREATIAPRTIVLNAYACGVWRGTLELQP